MYSAKQKVMKDLIKFLDEHYKDIQVFFTRSTFPDPYEVVYQEGNIQVRYSWYGYIEILGLSDLYTFMRETHTIHGGGYGNATDEEVEEDIAYYKLQEKIDNFFSSHKEYYLSLFDDTWVCDEPIGKEETRACWYFCHKRGEEEISEEEFESHYGITFKELAEYWNINILKL